MIDKELLENYKEALRQKYNAVCFDIDGTLTEDNSTKIDKRVLPMLANILKRHIPVVFITGRGETGLNDLLEDIVYDLKYTYGITNKQLLKMYALTNDGARLFFTNKDSEKIFDVNRYISKEEDLKRLSEFDITIKQVLKNKELDRYCNITYSKDSQNNNIINIRLAIKTKDEKIVNWFIDLINNLLKDKKYENLNLTLGLHEGKQILQIGTATKSLAVGVTERIIGIPQNSMLRIGDCGDETGNDYSMLNCKEGFSVLKTSKDKDKCFPVIDNKGNILTGIEATLYLLNQVKLLPTICLEHATIDKYIKEYSKIEKQMTLGKNKNISVFNSTINNKFELVEGIYGLYDIFSGSIKIPMYEWTIMDDENPLKKFWSKGYDKTMHYAIFDDYNLLLRGSRVYYYFLTKRIHNTDTYEDITTKDMVLEWLDNNEVFFEEAKDTLSSNNVDYDNVTNVKFLLGIIDNIRNYLLILLNQQIVSKNVNYNLLINLNSLKSETLIYQIYRNLIKADTLMCNISFNKDYRINNDDISSLCNEVITLTRRFNESFTKTIEKDNYSKDFRAYREIDNFAENFITCYLTLRKNEDMYSKGMCGLSYGGIELPIIMKMLDFRIEDVSILKFNKSVTGYSRKQSVDLRYFDIFENGSIKLYGIDKDKKYVLLDDNLLTGKTMQLAISSLYDINIDVDNIMVVRYPGVNRINQMFMPNHGAIDYRYFFDFIQGLYFPSPYSYRDPNSLDPYEDSLGVFDLNRKKILECLLKNGDYNEKGEVIKYRKRLVR